MSLRWTDVSEIAMGLFDQHPDVVEHLLALAEQAREDLGDLEQRGKDQRPAAMVDAAEPRVKKLLH